MKNNILIFSVLFLFFSCYKVFNPNDLSKDLTCKDCDAKVSQKETRLKYHNFPINLTSRRAIIKMDIDTVSDTTLPKIELKSFFVPENRKVLLNTDDVTKHNNGLEITTILD